MIRQSKKNEMIFKFMPVLLPTLVPPEEANSAHSFLLPLEQDADATEIMVVDGRSYFLLGSSCPVSTTNLQPEIPDVSLPCPRSIFHSSDLPSAHDGMVSTAGRRPIPKRTLYRDG